MQEMDQDKTVGCMCAGNDITGCTYANTNFSHVVLESAEPSEMSSDESILTLQREQTASAKSESDTSTNTEDEVSRQLSIYQMFMARSLDHIQTPLIEYDVVSIKVNEEDPLGESHNSSGSEVRKGFFPPRPFPVKTRDDLKKIRTERQIARRKRKNSESSDLSSAEGEATAKEQKVVCSQSTDSVISCWSQETLSGEVALSLPYASILERLQTKTLGKDLGLCGGIDVMDGKGDERVCDENVGRVDSCSVKTGTGKSAAGAATGGSKTPVASVESEPSSKVLCGVKRPAAESCSTL